MLLCQIISPNLEYVTAIESIGQKLREEDASELKADINTILRKGQPPQTKFKQGGKKGSISTYQRQGQGNLNSR